MLTTEGLFDPSPESHPAMSRVCCTGDMELKAVDIIPTMHGSSTAPAFTVHSAPEEASTALVFCVCYAAAHWIDQFVLFWSGW
jgi:hypothetical protein